MLLHHDILGVDTGAHTIKVARLQRRGPFWRAAGAFLLERTDRPEHDARALRALLRDKGWQHFPCVIGIRSELLSIRLLDAPERGEDGWRKLAASHIESFEVLAGAPAVTEFCVVRKGRFSRMMLVTARVDTIEREMEFVRAAGVQVLDIAPGPLALSAGLRRMLPRSRRPVIALDIGHEGTEFVVAHGEALLHVRRISIGARHLSSEHEDREPPVERPHFRQWLEEIHSAYRAFTLQHGDDVVWPETLSLTGGHALQPEQMERLAELLDVTPYEWASHDLPGASRHVSAWGLAWLGTGRNRMRISLLPPGIKAAETERRQARYWITTCAALSLAAMLALVNAHRDLRAKNRLLSAQTIWVEQLQQWESERAQLQERNTLLRQQVLPLRSAVRNNQAVRALLGAVSEARAPNDWFVFIADAESYNRFPARPLDNEPRPPGWEPFRHIVLEGYTPVDDLSTVRAMIEKLRAYPFILNVDLLADDKIQPEWSRPYIWMESGARRFALELEWIGAVP